MARFLSIGMARQLYEDLPMMSGIEQDDPLFYEAILNAVRTGRGQMIHEPGDAPLALNYE